MAHKSHLIFNSNQELLGHLSRYKTSTRIKVRLSNLSLERLMRQTQEKIKSLKMYHRLETLTLDQELAESTNKGQLQEHNYKKSWICQLKIQDCKSSMINSMTWPKKMVIYCSMMKWTLNSTILETAYKQMIKARMVTLIETGIK